MDIREYDVPYVQRVCIDKVCSSVLSTCVGVCPQAGVMFWFSTGFSRGTMVHGAKWGGRPYHTPAARRSCSSA